MLLLKHCCTFNFLALLQLAAHICSYHYLYISSHSNHFCYNSRICLLLCIEYIRFAFWRVCVCVCGCNSYFLYGALQAKMVIYGVLSMLLPLLFDCFIVHLLILRGAWVLLFHFCCTWAAFKRIQRFPPYMYISRLHCPSIAFTIQLDDFELLKLIVFA